MENKIKIILDTDPGVDDAITFLYATQCDKFDIQLIATEGGNSPVENITANALHLVELLGAEIPVVQGSKNPLKREAVYAKK